MKRLHSLTAIALTGMVGFTSICAPMAARASEEGKRNTAIGLGIAAAALLLTQRNKVPGLVVAGGAAYALSQTDRDRHDRDYDRNYNDQRFNRDDQNRFRQDDRNQSRQDYRGRSDRNDNRDSGHSAFGHDR